MEFSHDEKVPRQNRLILTDFHIFKFFKVTTVNNFFLLLKNMI